LAARVFALCELGRVEQARVTAGEFLNVAPDSPLVPRVLSSCAGGGMRGGSGPSAGQPSGRAGTPR
jgi:hypothetical protein